jgi:predicted acyl esterase
VRRRDWVIVGVGLRAGLAAAAVFGLALAPAAMAGKSESELTARGSVEQVYVTGAKPGKRVKLLHRGQVVDAKRAGELGGVVFRRLDPGRGYRVREGRRGESGSLRVLSRRARPPSKELYEQTIPAGGYGYLTTRDRTRLAINVHLPGPPGGGPYPTLVEYSGYGYANPAGPESGLGEIATLLGWAVVDVNMRGTGCSAGAFDYFERLQSLDGYDVIETVARQPWVLDGRVGMIGVSYGGNSQLFVAETRPPSLAAIAPMSVIDDTRTTLYPGGLLNTGFALEWAKDRVDDAEPAGPNRGQPWAWKRIQDGDQICADNQALHSEAADLLAKTRRNKFYRPEVADPLAPVKFVEKIDVPVFLACQWQDEQTGGHCPALASSFTGTRRKWFTFVNGTHSDSLDPETFNRLFDFIELYVGERRPDLPGVVKAAAPGLYASYMGIPGVTLPDDPIQQLPDYQSARSAFEELPPVRILFESGGGAAPGTPVPAFERSFRRLPLGRARMRSWYLADDGKLTRKVRSRGVEAFRWDPDARPPTSFSGDTGAGPGGLWTASPDYEWTRSGHRRALAYVTRRLRSDVAIVGDGELQVWLRASVRNVDLQATVSEVRPDGEEVFVQSGWLRSSARKLDRKRSTLGDPVHTYRRKDAKTLPTERWVKVRIPLYYQGHVYRERSRIRVILSAPGGDQPIWAFARTKPKPTPGPVPKLRVAPEVLVKHSRKRPSRLVLPMVRGLKAPTGLPPCPGLRGQPCRPYEPFANPSLPGR